jgi:hypothetical protein
VLAPNWQGRKGTAISAVGSARPDPKAREVTVARLRAVLGRPEMTDSDAMLYFKQLLALGDVTVQAFIEQQGVAETQFVEAMPPAPAGSKLTTVAVAAA